MLFRRIENLTLQEIKNKEIKATSIQNGKLEKHREDMPRKLNIRKLVAIFTSTMNNTIQDDLKTILLIEEKHVGRPRGSTWPSV